MMINIIISEKKILDTGNDAIRNIESSFKSIKITLK